MLPNEGKNLLPERANSSQEKILIYSLGKYFQKKKKKLSSDSPLNICVCRLTVTAYTHKSFISDLDKYVNTPELSWFCHQLVDDLIFYGDQVIWGHMILAGQLKIRNGIAKFITGEENSIIWFNECNLTSTLLQITWPIVIVHLKINSILLDIKIIISY